MIELVVIVIILIVIGCVKVYHATQRQAEKEREYVTDRRMCRCTGFCLVYDIVKAVLVLIAAGAIILHLRLAGDRGNHRPAASG